MSTYNGLRRFAPLALVLAGALGGGLFPPARAAGSVDCTRLLGSTPSGPNGVGQLLSIDPQTAQTTVIGDFSASSLATEVEYDPVSDLVYASEFAGLSHLHFVDPRTGQSLGSIEHEPGSLTGLELIAGQLYGTFSPQQGPTPSKLVIVDRTTGAFTTIGATGFGPISGLAYQAGSGVLYGITAGSGTAKLVTLDLSTGAAAVIGDTGLDKVGSIEFGPDGLLYGGTTDSAASLPTYLFRIDLATALVEPIGPTGVSITGLTACFESGPADSDGDGVADADDACPASDLGTTVVVGQCVTSVENVGLGNGCTINDEIGKCSSKPAPGHCVQKVVRRAYHLGLIDSSEAVSILGCAAGA